MDKCLSVIIPVFNEHSTVAEVIATVLSQPTVAELIIVNDASSDGTRDVLEGLKAGDPRIRVFHHNEYPILLGPILRGKADAVFGSRFIGSQEHRVLYFWHSLGNKFLTLLSNMCTNLNLTDMETCYKAVRREILQAISIEENRFGFEPEITAKLAKKGVRIYEVAVSYHGRTYAEGKKINWKDGVQAIWCILKYAFMR